MDSLVFFDIRFASLVWKILLNTNDVVQKVERSGIKLQKFVSRTETPEEKMDERKVSKRRAKFEKLSAKLEARKGRRKDLEKRYNDLLSKVSLTHYLINLQNVFSMLIF